VIARALRACARARPIGMHTSPLRIGVVVPEAVVDDAVRAPHREFIG
jgi:hypothetical protein